MVLLADLHVQPLSKYGGPNFWVSLGMDTIDLAHKVAKQNDNVPVVFLGDFFEYKDRHPNWLINTAREHIRASTDGGIEWFFLIGNHDIGSHNASIIEVFGDIPGVHVINKPQILNVNNTPCAFVPYYKSLEKTAEALSAMCGKAKIAFLHTELENAMGGLGYRFRDGITSETVDDFEWVFCGHYHKHQMVFKNALYIGSPYQTDFGERRDEKKGVWFFNSNRDALELYTVPDAPHFVSVHADITDMSLVDDFGEPVGDLNGDIVRVTMEVTKGERASMNTKEIEDHFDNLGVHAFIPNIKTISEKKDRLQLDEARFSWHDTIKKYGELKELKSESIGVGLDILETVLKNRSLNK